jgi:hypothetical protein
MLLRRLRFLVVNEFVKNLFSAFRLEDMIISQMSDNEKIKQISDNKKNRKIE